MTRWLTVALLIGALVAAAGAQTREHRVALVIGNAGYAESPLHNPLNDARGMTAALQEHGFQVIQRTNADNVGMRRAVAEFGERLREGGVGLFYYSGHGMQVNGRNYLIPIGADLRSEAYVGAEALEVDSVLGQMDAARSRVNVVILDACRNNPFARRFRSPTRGLAFMQAPLGTFIAYATSPGDVADDGRPGGYGLFTGELLRAMREPGKIEDVFKRVGLAVQQGTQRRQTPWTASNLTGDFAFVIAAAPAPLPAAPRIREEIQEALGSLAIKSTLPGIEVWLDTLKVGETRAGRALVVDDLRAGAYKIKATKPGHKDWEREVKVAPNERGEITITMEPIPPPAPPRKDPAPAPVASLPPAPAPESRPARSDRELGAAPKLRVGDEWRYSRGVVVRVVAIEGDRIVTTASPYPRCPDCRFYRDQNLTVVSIVDKNGKAGVIGEIGLQLTNFPLEVGKTWTSNVPLWSTSANRHLPYDNTFKVERLVDVKTKAGTFKAFEIAWTQENKAPGASWHGRATLYYSPEVRAIVKRQVHTSGWFEDSELESFKLGE